MLSRKVFSNGFMAFIDQFTDAVVVPIGDGVPEGYAQVGFIGAGPTTPPSTIAGRLPLVGDHGSSRPYKVVSFYTTDAVYTAHAANLRASLERHGVPYALTPLAPSGRWETTCARKAAFLRDAWRASDVPIVWIDADATLESPPTLFSSIDADFAVHKWNGWEFGSGTLYFGKSDLAGLLLDQWVLRCEADPLTWDQIHLQSAWCDVSVRHPLRTVFLPRSYLQIFDADGEDVVVKHWQASRAAKAASPMAPTPQFSITPSGIADRCDNRLWRNVEEAFWVEEGVDHVIPRTGDRFPEGFNVGAMLRRATGDRIVLEIGCGYGRLAGAFDRTRYVGVDVNPSAILMARRDNPLHVFRIVDEGYDYPKAGAVLLYTVLLHVDDRHLPAMLASATRCADRVVIAEMMDTRWRRAGDPPVFNRDPEHYILAMAALGYVLTSFEKVPYVRYDVEPWNVGRDSRLTMLVFDRIAAVGVGTDQLLSANTACSPRANGASPTVVRSVYRAIKYLLPPPLRRVVDCMRRRLEWS